MGSLATTAIADPDDAERRAIGEWLELKLGSVSSRYASGSGFLAQQLSTTDDSCVLKLLASGENPGSSVTTSIDLRAANLTTIRVVPARAQLQDFKNAVRVEAVAKQHPFEMTIGALDDKRQPSRSTARTADIAVVDDGTGLPERIAKAIRALAKKCGAKEQKEPF